MEAPPTPINQPALTQKVIKHPWLNVGLKFSYIIAFNLLFVIGAIFVVQKLSNQGGQPDKALLETKYQKAYWQNYGEVFEPLIKLPVYYPQTGYQDEEFLLDSGAVVSSLPREKATAMGFSLAQLPRTTFRGFGGGTSFAYNANLKARLGEEEITLPVVFTEAAGTKPILGRSGFFEKYSIHFNSAERKVEIRK